MISPSALLNRNWAIPLRKFLKNYQEFPLANTIINDSYFNSECLLAELNMQMQMLIFETKLTLVMFVSAKNTIISIDIPYFENNERTFLISKQKSFQKNKNDAAVVHVQIQLKEIDSVNKTALIEIQNTSFLADFWLYFLGCMRAFDQPRPCNETANQHLPPCCCTR